MASRFILATGAVLVILAGGALTLIGRPPELLRVGANYAAKTVCSNVFIAGREASAVLADDVQAPGHPILKHLQVRVDMERKIVRADLFGVIGNGVAVYRPGTGCAAVPDGDVARAAAFQYTPMKIWSASPNVPWPTGSMADTAAAVQQLVNQDALAGPGMRGVAVIHRGRLVAQRYGNGFGIGTPLLGWSMTKTVNAALVGTQIAEDKLAPPQSRFWPETADPRSQITLAQLMSMSSGLDFDEGYGDVSDVTRMLYLEPDMAAYAASRPLAQAPGSIWHYSSGDAMLLSRIWQRAAAGPGASAAAATSLAVLSLPHDRLFAPLGMSSAVIEADARGTLAGSSYMYATTHDWARFGQFLLQDGVWQGKRILPEGFVETMRQVAPVSGGRYGQGQVWRQGPKAPAAAEGSENAAGVANAAPAADNPDASFNLPADTFWLQGHDGQSIAVVPSKGLVVVRLGLTPRKLGYQPQALLAAVIKAIE